MGFGGLRCALEKALSGPDISYSMVCYIVLVGKWEATGRRARRGARAARRAPHAARGRHADARAPPAPGRVGEISAQNKNTGSCKLIIPSPLTCMDTTGRCGMQIQ